MKNCGNLLQTQNAEKKVVELTQQLKALQDDLEKQTLRSQAQSAENKVEELTQKLETVEKDKLQSQAQAAERKLVELTQKMEASALKIRQLEDAAEEQQALIEQQQEGGGGGGGPPGYNAKATNAVHAKRSMFSLPSFGKAASPIPKSPPPAAAAVERQAEPHDGDELHTDEKVVELTQKMEESASRIRELEAALASKIRQLEDAAEEQQDLIMQHQATVAMARQADPKDAAKDPAKSPSGKPEDAAKDTSKDEEIAAKNEDIAALKAQLNSIELKDGEIIVKDQEIAALKAQLNSIECKDGEIIVKVPGPVVEKIVVKKEIQFVDQPRMVMVEKIVEVEKIVHVTVEKAVEVPVEVIRVEYKNFPDPATEQAKLDSEAEHKSLKREFQNLQESNSAELGRKNAEIAGLVAKLQQKLLLAETEGDAGAKTQAAAEIADLAKTVESLKAELKKEREQRALEDMQQTSQPAQPMQLAGHALAPVSSSMQQQTRLVGYDGYDKMQQQTRLVGYEPKYDYRDVPEQVLHVYICLHICAKMYICVC
jgi:hypothetical protein